MTNEPEQVLRGFMTRPGQGELLPAAGGHLLGGVTATGGRLTVVESTVGAGDETPLHVHEETDEAFYVLDGEFAVRCGPDTFTATSGCFVYLPHGVPHAYRAGDGGGRQLILGIPAGLEDFFRDMHTTDDWNDLGRRHGITFL